MSDEGDTPDQASQAAGPAQAAASPRRVVLRHDDTGSYQILMGHRLIQGFCQEFEEITGYAIGANLQQQVRIHIEPIGRRQHAHYPDREPPPMVRHRDPEEAVMIRTTDEGIEQEDVNLWKDVLSSALRIHISRCHGRSKRGGKCTNR